MLTYKYNLKAKGDACVVPKYEKQFKKHSMSLAIYQIPWHPVIVSTVGII